MKKLITITFLFASIHTNPCVYHLSDRMSFYNLMSQTNISAEEYYPFLREQDFKFYNKNTSSNYTKGNISLWQEILTNWSVSEIEKAVYDFHSFNWENKNSEIEKRVNKYLEFAEECSRAFKYRNKTYTWDYDQIINQKNIDPVELVSKAHLLLSQESIQQLKSRYYYQLIRILHYTKSWNDVINIFENYIDGKIPVNEIYYYIVDQVAGCYYSLKNYDKAAYLFTKVFNQSYDRKKSAFTSYSFCIRRGFEGKKYFKSIEDEKDLLLIKSLYRFSDRVSNIDEFISLDPNDKRIELLFMRLLNRLEQSVWPKNIGCKDKNLPNLENARNIEKLATIAAQQAINTKVNNKDFWLLASSYFHFINEDLEQAKAILKEVHAYKNQKIKLSIIYEVFSWKSINHENENALAKILNKYARFKSNGILNFNSQVDWIKIILDKISNIYFTNNQIAKSYLIHKNLQTLNYLNSFKLLNALEDFYLKDKKSDFEKILVLNSNCPQRELVDYIYNQKGIFYLYNQKPDSALIYFTKNKNFKNELLIPDLIFSNSIRESYTKEANKIMDDEVYKANIFAFIKPKFSRKELSENLIRLEKLRQDSLLWKRKLANYLLGNYYYNISNTGYYRGLLNNRPNTHQFDYLGNKREKIYDDEIIAKGIGFNLLDIGRQRKKYKQMCKIARPYFENTIKLSTDDELNARCLFMIAKCELNDYCNLGTGWNGRSYVRSSELFNFKSYKDLKDNYSDTKFYAMIIKECSFFRHYSAAN